MDLLEYQAKELFQEIGIPVLPSQHIRAPRDLKDLRIPYPIVLKSQVRRGGRGKAGGIRFAQNTIDAIAVAQTIFNLCIQGEYPELLLAEVKYDAAQEFYLAVTLDRSLRRPVLLGSQRGGIQVEDAMKQVQAVVVEQTFSPFYARRLAVKMGLQGVMIQTISQIIEKMYSLFIQKDLDLVEINPLGISAEKAVMALDGKVIANDNALARHADLAQMASKITLQREGHILTSVEKDYFALAGDPLWVELEGEIAIICNGAGLTMATLDQVVQAGGKPAGFLNLGGETHHYYPSGSLTLSAGHERLEPLAYHRLERGLEALRHSAHIKVILVNVFSGFIACDRIVEILAAYYQHPPLPTRKLPQLVVRLMGSLEQAKLSLADTPVILTDSLDQAITQAVKLTRMTDTDVKTR